MGSGSWSASTYSASTASKIATGTSYAYSSAVASGAASSVHEALDPNYRAKSGLFAGKTVREARDNDEHPNSLPVGVFFDVTGSMGMVPRTLQKKVPEIYGLLLRKGYADDPQVAVGGYGDIECDAYPIQVGQFESDNRADDTLDNLILEGGGGGNGYESASSVWWFMGRFAELDSLDKRGKKGYLFTVGDETTGPVDKALIKRFVEDADMEKSLTPAEALALAQEKFEVYHLIINNSTAHWQDSIKFYTELLGDHAIVLEDEDAVAETVAVLIGLNEGTIDSVDEAMDDLDDIGASDDSKRKVGSALAKFSGGGKGSVAVATAPADLDSTEGVARL